MKKKVKSSLKVTPVKRYKTAKYPGFNDPNPLDHPDTLPYPFSEKVLKLLCTMGFTGALLLGSPEESEAAAPDVISLAEQDSLQNPFTEKMSGLPYRPASFGTGLPSRLRREESIAVIDRVFREEGIALDSMVNIEENGVVVTADRYNKDLKLGYIFMDYSRFGEGTMITSRTDLLPLKFNEKYKVRKGQYNHLNGYLDKGKYSYKNLSKKGLPPHMAFKKFIDDIYPNLDVSIREQTFINQYLIFSMRIQLAHIETDYPDFTEQLIQYFDSADDYSFEKLERLNVTLSVLKQVKQYFGDKADSAFVKELLATIDESEKKWRIATNNMYVLFNRKRLAKNTESTALNELLHQAFTETGKEQQKIFTAIDCEVDLIKVDMSELKSILSAADQNEYFLAPISQRDHRFSYRSMFYRSSPEEIKQMEERLKTATDPIRQKQLKRHIEQQKAMLAKKEPTPREKTLIELETQVRNYIHWAKTQIGY